MAISCGYVYVVHLAMGGNQGRYIKAFMEAEAFPDPYLIIACTPCINYLLRSGMGKSRME
jgi:pyruvate-ferredoxin/flavodoxin oxidoreductase